MSGVGHRKEIENTARVVGTASRRLQRRRRRSRGALWHSLAAVTLLLAGIPLAGIYARPALADGTCVTTGATSECTFASTGAEQTFAVPGHVGAIFISAIGGMGGGSGGRGALVTAAVPVPTGVSTLYVEVGGNATSSFSSGGFNGGGSSDAGGGGGASDVRTCLSTDTGAGSCSTCPTPSTTCSTLGSRLVVAGGGGGAGGGSTGGAGGPGGDAGQNGGAGAGGATGGSTPGAPGGSGGGGATVGGSGAGGAGGAGTGGSGLSGQAGTFGAGANGDIGGGGGGGYYGGGSGGDSGSNGVVEGGAGGGGAGSSFVTSTALTSAVGINTSGTPSIVIGYVASTTPAFVSHISVRHHGHSVIIRWRSAIRSGVVGFEIYADQRRLDRRIIPIHRSSAYCYTVRGPVPGALSLRVLFADGQSLTETMG